MGSIEMLIKEIYDLFRTRLPRKQSKCNGVLTRRAYLFDRTTDWPDYEEELLSLLRANISEGDSVVIVGGGWGVSAVTAAEYGASVTVYEPSDEQVKRVEETVSLNNVAQSVSINHARVSESGEVWGGSSASTVSPSNLPECDLLELDCEGAELDILRSLKNTPETIVVECHPNHGVDVSDVRSLLAEKGYVITKSVTEDQSSEVVILTAEQDKKS